jgi:ATP-dependent RNA helicase SUPV3L1/SUV3
LRLLLWALHEGLAEFPEAPPPGLATIPAVVAAPNGYYPRAGYRLAGERAIRIDMLERLADMLRVVDSRDGFEATGDMLSITGMTLDQFADLMGGLGYGAERGERVKVKAVVAAASIAAVPEVALQTVSLTSDSDIVASDAAPVVVADDAIATAIEQPADQAGADAPVQSAEATVDIPAIPVAAPEMETFITFRWVPKKRQVDSARSRTDAPSGDTPRRHAPRKEGARPEADGKNGERKSGPRNSGLRTKGKKPQAQDKPKFVKPEPRAEKPIDPDNPFAALMALKNKS